MGQALLHRGPDSHGEWCDQEAGIAFAHRRLAIVDLSAAGHQPMLGASGRFVLTFNGEIYNHTSLRQELTESGQAPEWRGSSDTETLLAAIAAWGVAGALRRCAGMFAFAVFDRKDRVLTLARDRMGEKPLYYGWAGQTLVFGSELRALRQIPGCPAEISSVAVQLFLRFNYIPDPLTIFRDVFKLPAGHVLRVKKGHPQEKPEPYWSYAEGAEHGAAAPLDAPAHEVEDQLERALQRTIAGQLMSDVPLGALLSGGIDSSLVVALAQQQSSRPLKTFTIGFKEQEVNEAHFARSVATHLGTEHHELQLEAAAALDLVTDLPQIFDEPFADPSQMPTYLVSRMARETVTVALTGDGADEIFGGYSRYLAAPAMWQKVQHLPVGMRRRIGRGMRALPKAWIGRRARRVADAMGEDHGMDGIYLASLTQNPRAGQLVADAITPDALLLAPRRWPLDGTDAARFMALDAVTYLPGDLMTKVDRAAMAVSLETRAPYLDRDVMELAWRIPQDLKIRDKKTKWILRKLLAKHLPQTLIERPKMGFGIPVAEWLRGPLYELAEHYLSADRLRASGLLNVAVARQIWTRHKSRAEDNANAVWSLLMLQIWLEAHTSVQAGPSPVFRKAR